jgi:sugar phosphate isomerase/epimerase
MKLGVFLAVYHDRPLEDALDRAVALGLEAVEIATGNYPGDAHCRPAALLDDRGALDDFRRAIEHRGLEISALSQQGNPLHPDPAVAGSARETWRSTVRLAAELGIGVVNAFSGCPGDHEGARRPNWVTCSWPDDFPDTLAWQWEHEVVPYWRAEAQFAAEHGVLAGIEMHPGNVVYNPATLVRLREQCGPAITANFDPSHLFWQGIDPVAAIEHLTEHLTMSHVDAKDTALVAANIAVNGVIETQPAANTESRAWLFRTIGHGHDAGVWAGIVAALRRCGYDGVVSIEHEDRLLPADDGLSEAVALLGPLV